MHKGSHKIINKTYIEYRQRELNERGESTGKVLGHHVINLHSPGISWVFKVKDVKKLQDIKNDLIIKDQMADLGCYLVIFLSLF